MTNTQQYLHTQQEKTINRRARGRTTQRAILCMHIPSISASSLAWVVCLSFSCVTAGSFGPLIISFWSFLSFSSQEACSKHLMHNWVPFLAATGGHKVITTIHILLVSISEPYICVIIWISVIYIGRHGQHVKPISTNIIHAFLWFN